MKKLSIIFLFTILIFMGCGDNKETQNNTPEQDVTTFDSTEIKTSSVDASTVGLVKLNYQLKKGNTYNFRLTSIADDNQKITADTVMEQKVVQTITYLINSKVNEVEADGVMEVEFNFKSVKLTADANGKKYSYKSGTVLDSTDKDRYLEYEALVNNPFTVRLDSNGDILDVFRADKIVNKLLELRNMKDSVSAEDKKLLQQDMVEGALKPMVAQVFRKFPSTEVGKDSTWKNVLPEANLQLFTLQTIQNFKLGSFENFNGDNLAVITADVTANYKISPQAKQNKVDVKNPEYRADGKIYFNLNKGLIQKSITTTSMKIQFSVNMPTPQQTMQKVTRTQTTINKNILELLN
ncbi:MAG: DUF6263 family protein [Ignavibacteriaceae bacterium]|nr:DUF6263 family protein [Ignavibacteriaceae bacterium]